MRESAQIKLNCKKALSQVKGLCQNGQLEKCKNSQNRDFEVRFQDKWSTHDQNFDVCCKKTKRSRY